LRRSGRAPLALTATRIAGLALGALAAALGAPPLAATELSVDGVAIHLDLDERAFQGGTEPLLEWVRRSADIVTHYYGHFPANRLSLRIMAADGGGVHGGKTWANPDAVIRVTVGREATAQQLLSDWVLVHEMTHLALPDTGEEHAWLSEGLATYVEGVARVQAGNRAETDVWSEELRSMPHGMPQAGDRGLDRTHTWGRTYWGGAMFCLMADVAIRRETHNRAGLQQALRALLRASGGLSADWPIERVLRTADEAVGTRTLEQLYAQMKDSPVAPDLLALWHELGVDPEGDGVRLNDNAPLAAVRRAIMSPQ
jgi:hypothetical protein